MKINAKFRTTLSCSIALLISSNITFATNGRGNLCAGLPGHDQLVHVLKESVFASGGPMNGGFDLNMWGTIVANDGTVCAVARTGGHLNDQWLGSRVISAQKANTAAAFSLNGEVGGLALSTANLFTAVQPGNSLFGLQLSNPVNPDVAYNGNSKRFGNRNDPMVGNRVGGVNVFGGGLALYDKHGKMLGAVGVSGDSSCADHNVAWRVRDGLGLDYIAAGVGNPGDNIIFDESNGFGHASCGDGVEAANDAVVTACPLGDGSTHGCRD